MKQIPGAEQVLAVCAGEGCDFTREATGKVACLHAIREAQRHANRTGHPISLHHKHTAIYDLNDHGGQLPDQ